MNANFFVGWGEERTPTSSEHGKSVGVDTPTYGTAAYFIKNSCFLFAFIRVHLRFLLAFQPPLPNKNTTS
jgi:hypothetical protein